MCHFYTLSKVASCTVYHTDMTMKNIDICSRGMSWWCLGKLFVLLSGERGSFWDTKTGFAPTWRPLVMLGGLDCCWLLWRGCCWFRFGSDTYSIHLHASPHALFTSSLLCLCFIHLSSLESKYKQTNKSTDHIHLWWEFFSDIHQRLYTMILLTFIIPYNSTTPMFMHK